jgi:hypothetical protein
VAVGEQVAIAEYLPKPKAELLFFVALGKALDLSDEQRLSIEPSDIELRFAR